MHSAITLESHRFLEIRRRLLELNPEIDEETLADTLEGATNLHEVIANLIRSALDDESLAKALKERVDMMRGRLTRLETRASSKRQVAAENMEKTQLRKLVQPDFTASVRQAPPSIGSLDEWSLPEEYLVPQPSRPNRRSILDALLRGLSVPGAALADARTMLTVRGQ